MKKAVLVVCLLSMPWSGTLAQTSSPLTLVGELLLVVNTDSDSISIVDVSAQPFVLAEIPVGKAPQTVYADPTVNRAYVSNRGSASLTVVNLDTLATEGCVSVGAEPFGVVANARHIFTANQSGDSISIIDRETLQPLLEIVTDRAPKGLALSEDGSLLYVTHFFNGNVSVIDTRLMAVVSEIGVNQSANISQSMTIDHANALAYLPQTFSNTSNQALLFDTTVFPMVTVIDLAERVEVRRRRIAVDIADRPVGIPIAAAFNHDGLLYVVNAASNDISVINPEIGTAIAHIDVAHNPRGIVMSPDKRRAYVSNTLSGTVSIIDGDSHVVIDEVRVTDIPLAPRLLNGKRLFNSSDRPDLSRDQWVACASCHFDAEHDARSWFFPDGLRNTPSLLGVGETLPMHWSGDLDELQDVESTIREIQGGTGLAVGTDNCDPTCDRAPPNSNRSADLDDLAMYMQSLEFEQGRRGLLSVEEKAGEELFLSPQVGCAGCHVPPLYTDRLRHDVGTGNTATNLRGSSFDTPSLRGLQKSAPYLHDGRAPTLQHVLLQANPADLHGTTSQLSMSELTALEAFLNTLPYGSAADQAETCEMPSAVGAAVKLAMFQDQLTAGDELLVNLHAGGNERVDIYAAIQFPDGAFVTIDDAMRVSEFDQVIPFRLHHELSSRDAFEVLKIELPNGLPEGRYTVFGILATPGSSPLNTKNWIVSDEVAITLTR